MQAQRRACQQKIRLSRTHHALLVCSPCCMCLLSILIPAPLLLSILHKTHLLWHHRHNGYVVGPAATEGDMCLLDSIVTCNVSLCWLCRNILRIHGAADSCFLPPHSVLLGSVPIKRATGLLIGLGLAQDVAKGLESPIARVKPMWSLLHGLHKVIKERAQFTVRLIWHWMHRSRPY